MAFFLLQQRSRVIANRWCEREAGNGKIGVLVSAFTLIELLVVIAIIAILSVVVILTLNPAELLRQSRDTNRISDMSSLSSALGIYEAQGGTSIGNASVVYVSIPDPAATSSAGDQCQGLGLPTLPLGYTYQCAATSTYRMTNGTGWIPVNFASIPAGSPFGSLPIDPVNQSSSRLYYTYDTNGSQYEVTSVMESAKYGLGGSNDVIGPDGGTLASVYEKGSKLGLEPLDYGDNTLVGYWPLDEGSGTVAYDDSGNNATGSWSGSQIGSNGYYGSGHGGYSYAGDFDGKGDDAVTTTMNNVTLNDYTVSFWYDSLAESTDTSQSIDVMQMAAVTDYYPAYLGSFRIVNTPLSITTPSNGVVGSSGLYSVLNTWEYFTVARGGTTIFIYLNGVLQVSAPATGGSAGNPSVTIGGNNFPSRMLIGLMTGIRVYNRALTAAQIAAMYAGGK